MLAYLAIYSVAHAACWLHTGRTPFWYLARAMEILDEGCAAAWRAGALFFRVWRRGCVIRFAAREAEG